MRCTICTALQKRGSKLLKLIAEPAETPRPGTALYKILFRIWYLCWNLTFMLSVPQNERITRVIKKTPKN